VSRKKAGGRRQKPTPNPSKEGNRRRSPSKEGNRRRGTKGS